MESSLDYEAYLLNLETATEEEIYSTDFDPALKKNRSGLKRSLEATWEEIAVPVPWGTVQGKCWGDLKSKTRILAVHGWLDNAATFDQIIPNLPPSYCIVAMDLPGHGFSSHFPPGMHYHVIDFVTTTYRVIRHLGWDVSGFIYMGHSLGSIVGCYLASVYPDMVEKMILLDAIGPGSEKPELLAGSIARTVAAFTEIEEKGLRDAGAPAHYSYQTMIQRLVQSSTLSGYPLTEAAAKILLSRGAREVGEDSYVYTRDDRVNVYNPLKITGDALMGLVSSIKCHLLVIWTGNTPHKNPLHQELIQNYEQKCASFTFVEVKGNHFIHLLHAPIVVAHVNRFLASN